MKVFISHQKDDYRIAKTISEELIKVGVDTYLDGLDKDMPKGNSEALTRHIRSNLLDCTDVLVLMTLKTKKSWWVPFEIGLAEGNEIPVVTWLTVSEQLPEYLDFWPRISALSQLHNYVDFAKKRLNEKVRLQESFLSNVHVFSAEDARADFETYVRELNLSFYKDLKKSLRGIRNV